MRTIAIILFLGIALNAFCQNTIGLPEIINYSKQAYSAGARNWDIKQDKGGVLYFGNNEGLLSFDGTFWKLYPLPNKSIVCAVEITSDQKIYTGGQNEFGYFFPDKKGQLTYHSLLDIIPAADRSFDDVWNICSYGNDIFFRTNKRIFQLSNNKITVYPTRSEWRFLGVSNNQLITEDLETGNFLFQNGAWVPFLRNPSLPVNSLITSFVTLDSRRSLIATLKDGLFIYDGNNLTKILSPNLEQLSKKLMYKAIVVDKNRIALATTFDGCHIIDEQGNVIQSLTQQDGLQNNNIRSIYSDRNDNLWLGLDNGVDFIAFNNSIKHIYPQSENIGSGWSAIVFKNDLYLGTSISLYKVSLGDAKNLSFIKSKLQRVNNTEGEVRNLSVINDRLLMGHHNGAFLIENNSATLLDNFSGFWTFSPTSSIFPSALTVAGNYRGLRFFEFKDGTFSKSKIEAQFESARFVVVENEHTIWVAHPYKGIFKIRINPDNTTTIDLYNHLKGLVSNNNYYVFKIKNRIVIVTEKGLYEYNEQKNAFEISEYFKNLSTLR